MTLNQFYFEAMISAMRRGLSLEDTSRARAWREWTLRDFYDGYYRRAA